MRAIARQDVPVAIADGGVEPDDLCPRPHWGYMIKGVALVDADHAVGDQIDAQYRTKYGQCARWSRSTCSARSPPPTCSIFIPAGAIVFFKDGPLAYDGFLALYIPLGVFLPVDVRLHRRRHAGDQARRAHPRGRTSRARGCGG